MLFICIKNVVKTLHIERTIPFFLDHSLYIFNVNFRWLICHQRYSETESLIKSAADTNGVNISPSLLNTKPQQGWYYSLLSFSLIKLKR